MTPPPEGVGKRVGRALYLHISAVTVVDKAIRDRIERAASAAEHPEWNVAKVHADAVSLLTYEAFDEAAFPALLAAVRVNLIGDTVKRIDYRDRDNPPILHRKETLLRADDPGARASQRSRVSPRSTTCLRSLIGSVPARHGWSGWRQPG